MQTLWLTPTGWPRTVTTTACGWSRWTWIPPPTTSGHISGAVGWNWETQLSDGIQRDIASPEQWKDLLESSGISADTHVILYGDNNNWFAAFAYWQFKLAGHDRVSLMNGGRLKWEQEGRELTTAPSER